MVPASDFLGSRAAFVEQSTDSVVSLIRLGGNLMRRPLAVNGLAFFQNPVEFKICCEEFSKDALFWND